MYHAPAESMRERMNVPPEEMAKGMEMWTNWFKKAGNNIVDMGSPLMNGQQIGTDGSVSNSSKNVSGYSIIQAENMDEAKALMEGHPHTSGWNASATIEIHETMPMPGM